MRNIIAEGSQTKRLENRGWWTVRWAGVCIFPLILNSGIRFHWCSYFPLWIRGLTTKRLQGNGSQDSWLPELNFLQDLQNLGSWDSNLRLRKKSPKFLFLVCNSLKHDYLTSPPSAMTKQSFFQSEYLWANWRPCSRSSQSGAWEEARLVIFKIERFKENSYWCWRVEDT